MDTRFLKVVALSCASVLFVSAVPSEAQENTRAHPVSWLGIPPLMIILWSIGLILYSWRYR